MFSLNWWKGNHIGKFFRAAENFTLTLIVNSYISRRNFTNFTNFAKFKLIRKILSHGTWSWNLYAKDYPRIFRFTFFYSGKFKRWKIIYSLIAKVSFQILQSELPVMLKDYELFWAPSCLILQVYKKRDFRIILVHVLQKLNVLSNKFWTFVKVYLAILFFIGVSRNRIHAILKNFAKSYICESFTGEIVHK